MATITCTTSAVTFTESSSTVTRDRVFTASVELTAFAENASIVGASATIACSTAGMTFTESAAAVAIFRATIAQTFSGMTQAATAEASYHTLHETALAQGYPRDTQIETLTDTALAGDQLYAIENQYLTDVANATDEITHTTATPLHETAVGDGGYAGSTQTHIEHHTAAAKDRLRSVVVVALHDTANASDTQQTLVSTSLRATGYASDVLTPSAVANNLLSSTATGNADPIPYFVAELAESATAANTIVEYTSQSEVLSSALTATEELVIYAVANELLSSTAVGDDTQDSAGSILNNLLDESATAAGYPWAKDFAAAAWVMNTETTGLTNYDNFQFTSLVQLDGVVYGTTADGIYALSGADDAGRKVKSALKTGFLDFGRDQTKRVSDLYVGYTGGQLECTVETYDGPQEEYTYTLEERDADAPRNNRMKVGKGLSSRYWRFTFENVDGTDFQIYDTAANVATSKRRL
jgi:hypothetical protein